MRTDVRTPAVRCRQTYTRTFDRPLETAADKSERLLMRLSSEVNQACSSWLSARGIVVESWADAIARGHAEYQRRRD